MRELPIACSLDRGALEGRLEEVQAIGREALIHADSDGILRFRASPAIRARLQALVTAEAECCPFLELDLREADGELRLAISAPEGAEPVAAELARAFAGR
jgi:hypothetical protein